MSDETLTKPTLGTLSKQIEEMRTEIRAGFAFTGEELSTIKKRLDIVEPQLVQMDARNDPHEALLHQIRSEMSGLRATFQEYRAQFKGPV